MLELRSYVELDPRDVGFIRRGAAVKPSEELRHHAAECNRMANSTRGGEKATWSQMAERWLVCAKQADDECATVQFRIEAHRSTRPKPPPTPSTTSPPTKPSLTATSTRT